MKVLLGMLPVFLGLPLCAASQTPKESTGHGYLVVAPLASRNRVSGNYAHIGFGGESPIYKGIGAGVEFGPVFQWSRFEDTAFALGSANISYHFSSATLGTKMDPFLTAGYSIFIRAGTDNGANFGGGINLWLKPKIGLRVDLREYTGNVRAHHLGPRIGVAFR
jgi:hypothetical protein